MRSQQVCALWASGKLLSPVPATLDQEEISHLISSHLIKEGSMSWILLPLNTGTGSCAVLAAEDIYGIFHVVLGGYKQQWKREGSPQY